MVSFHPKMAGEQPPMCWQMCDEKRKSKQITRPPRMEWSFKSSFEEALKRGTPKSRMSPLFSLLRKDFYCSAFRGRFPWLKFLGFTSTTYYSPRKTKIAQLKSDSWKTNSFPFEMLPFFGGFWFIFARGGWKFHHIKTLSNLFVPPASYRIFDPKKLKSSVETHAWALKKQTSPSRKSRPVFYRANKTARLKLHRISLFRRGRTKVGVPKFKRLPWRPAWKDDSILKTRGGVWCVLPVWFPNKNIELRL